MRAVKWIGIIVAVLVVVVVSLPFLINVNQFRPKLESELSTALNREVKLGNLKLALLKGEITADDLSVSEDQAFGKPAFIRAKSLSVGAQIWPFLLSRKLIVTYLTIDQPEVELVQAPSGEWNFSSLGAKTQKAPAAAPAPGTEPLDLSVKLVRISDGRLKMGRTAGHWKPLLLEQVNLELRDFSANSAFPFTLAAKVAGGGTIGLTGNAGPINPTDTAMTPVKMSLKVVQLDLAGSGVNEFAPDLAGILALDANGTSDGRNMQLQGNLRVDKIKMASKATPASRPLALDFAVDHDLRKHSGAVRQGTIHIGSAVARLTGTYAEQGDAVVLNMKLAGPNMAVPELAAMLPAMGVVLPAGSHLEGGTASAMLTMQGPAAKLVTSGTLALNKTRLTGFDLGKKMATIERLAGMQGGPNTDIDTLSASIRVAPEGTDAQDMRLVVPAIGELNGAGTVSPAKALDFRMRASVQASIIPAAARNVPIPFTIQGTCSDPVFRPDVKGLLKEEVNAQKDQLKKAAGGLLRGLLGGKQ